MTRIGPFRAMSATAAIAIAASLLSATPAFAAMPVAGRSEVVAAAVHPAASSAPDDPAPTPAPTLTTSPAPLTSVFGYYRTPWTSNTAVYEVRADSTIRKLTREQWRDVGEPAVAVAPVSYVRTSWSPTVYALITWPHEAGDAAVDQVVALAPSVHRSAGSPSARLTGHISTTTYFRYASGPKDVYARTPDGAGHLLTAAEHRAAGSPAAAEVVSGGYYRAAWSKKIFFVAPSGRREAIEPKKYADRGEPQVSRAPTVYARTPWSGTVHALITWPNRPDDRDIDQVVRLTPKTHAAAGRPTPVIRYRIPGDVFVRLTVGTTIYHRLSGTLTPVTATQWRAAGSPKLRTETPKKPTYIRDIAIVNKSLSLPSSFGGGLRPELTRSFAAMQKAAMKDGVSLRIISGFRSFSSQQSIFAGKVRQLGRAEAERRSARPGHSEHQTGLAIDVNSISQAWGETRAGRWVAAHAHEHGFVVRYPKGKEHITGFRWEPWHLRHVGSDVAAHLKKKKMTLEEYLGVPSRY